MSMTLDAERSRQSFSYSAQSYDGKPVSGTIEAIDADDAARQLLALKLRIMMLSPSDPPARARPLGRDDFVAFNQQLAHLAGAGLPIEQGLRLIAEDMRSGRTAQSVREVAAELERGVPLGEAFKIHRNHFPALYGTVVEAGVRSGNLSAALLSLGRHLDLVARLRASLWRAAAYPLAVLAGVFFVLIFLSVYVFPQFRELYDGMSIRLPAITRGLFVVAAWTPWIIALGVGLFVGAPLLHRLLRMGRLEQAMADLALPLPMFGTLLRRNLIARWCDALKLAVTSGMDLPAALEHAAEVIGSPALRRDTAKLVARLNQGHPIDQSPTRLSVLPIAVLAVVRVSAERGDLADSLATLSSMYEQQAQMQLDTVQTVVGPTLILLVAVLVGTVILGLFAPLISLLRAVSSP